MKHRSKVTLGAKLISDGRFRVIADDNSHISIGANTYFNDGAMISCKLEITIGKDCRFGPDVKIFDNDHYFSKEKGVTDEHKSSPIYIGDNTWIGANCVILRGTTIGSNCVIGAGSIVKGDIPAGSLVKPDRQLIISPIK